MLDAKLRPVIDQPLNWCGRRLARAGCSADACTAVGFVCGACAILLLLSGAFVAGGLFFLLNRVCDGLDGAIARAQGATDFGGYLDIVSDFIIYPGIPTAIAVQKPEDAVYAVFCVCAMSTAMASFLAFAISAEKLKLHSTARGIKSFFYVGGLCEGFETTVALTVMCFWHDYFHLVAVVFGVLCWLTTIVRVYATRRLFARLS